MSDTPKFEVIDRRKQKAQEEEQNRGHEPQPSAPEPPAAAAAEPASNLGPRLVVNEPQPESAPEPAAEAGHGGAPAMPPPPPAEEFANQTESYKAAAQRIEDLIRAQNPAMGAQPPIGFENLVQQFYLSAMIQMGAGAQPGERPRIDIVGARTTIDLIALLYEKTRGTLSETEDAMLRTVLFEVRSVFLELASMVSMAGVKGGPMTPPPGVR
jgi:hypothetical protein